MILQISLLKSFYIDWTAEFKYQISVFHQFEVSSKQDFSSRWLTEHYPAPTAETRLTRDPRTERSRFESPLRSQELAWGTFWNWEPAEARGADPASFKWALKTGHFYRFIRTFRTSWVLLGAQCEALAHHSLHQNPAWEKLIYFSSFSLQRLYKFMTFIHLLYLFKVFQKRWNDFKS